jgi:hypothetical protein
VGPFLGVGSYTALINWGDGQSSPGTITVLSGGGFAVSGSHTYAAGGDFPLTITVTDSSSTVATANAVMHVAAAPAVQPPPPGPGPGPGSGSGGSDATVLLEKGPRRSRNWRLGGAINATDAGAHTVLIDWGDGKTTRVELAPGDTGFNVTHRYTHRNARGPVTVTVLDSTGGAGTPTRARTANELWVIDLYQSLGRTLDERTLATWATKLDRCRDNAATRRQIERKVQASSSASSTSTTVREGRHAH